MVSETSDGATTVSSVSALPMAEPKRTPLRVCMLAYTFYESDNRVMRYAEALARRGDSVEVIALKRSGSPAKEIVNGVTVRRVQARVVSRRGRAAYIAGVVRFMIRSLWIVSKEQLNRGYDVVHVHSVPDFLIFSALGAKLGGARLILDIHDIVPELYLCKFNRPRNSFAFKLLLRLERICCAMADHVIVANHIWLATLTGRSVEESKCSAVLNYPDPAVFSGATVEKNHGRQVRIIYPGTLSRHQGVDLIIEALGVLKDSDLDLRLDIYGEGVEREELETLAKGLGLADKITFHSPVPIREVARIMSSADIAVEPKRAETFAGEALSTKILEFMALGVPVIASDTQAHRYYFGPEMVSFFRSGDAADLAAKIREMASDETRRTTQVKESTSYVDLNNWRVKRQEYFNLVDRLRSNGLRD